MMLFLVHTSDGNVTSMIIMLIIFTSVSNEMPVVVRRRNKHEPVSPVVLKFKATFFVYMHIS